MDEWLEDGLDWLKQTFHSRLEAPIDIEQTSDGVMLQQGPVRTRTRYVSWLFVEALAYGLIVAALVLAAILFGQERGASTLTLQDRLEGGSYFGSILGVGCFVCAFPVLLLIRRKQLEWSRFEVGSSGIRWTKGSWFGRRRALRIDEGQIATSQAKIECTPHLDVAEDRELVDLTFDSIDDFSTFAAGLPPDQAQQFADAANRVLANKGCSGAL